MATTKPNLRQKLAIIQNEVRGLGKNADQRTYQYVTESKVLEHIKPRMADLGLILNTEVTDVSNQRIDYATSNGHKSAMFTRVKMRFTWLDTDSDETLTSEWAGIGMNDWDKGFGSAITYGHRYYLLKFFHIATDADDVDALTDEAHTEDTAAVTPPATPPAPQVNAYTAVKEAIYKDLQQITDPAQIKPFYLANKTRLNPEDVDGLKIACELHSKALTNTK